MSAFTDNIAGAFAEYQVAVKDTQSARLASIRSEAFDAVKTLGLPGPRDEQWKYTNVAKIGNADLKPLAVDSVPQLNANDIPTPAFSEHRIVFVDGRYAPDLSSSNTLPTGISVTPISTLFTEDESALLEALSEDLKQSNVFTLLNTSFFNDGLLLEIDANCQAPAIEVLFVGSGKDQLSCPRLIVKAARNSSTEIIETHCSTAPSNGLTSAVTDIQSAEGSQIKHYRVQLDDSAHHIGNVNLHAASDSTISTYSLALGGDLTRVDINGSLNEPGSHVDMFGLFMAQGHQHIDHHTRINHLAAHTTSNENFKGIADGNGRGVFNGKIFVEQDAQKIVATQSSKNLLLSNDAEIDTKPELEIYADDVQCAHGATVGQLREDELFYLRSRGIDSNTARTMLTIAFAGDVVEEIANESLRKFIEQYVASRLNGATE